MGDLGHNAFPVYAMSLKIVGADIEDLARDVIIDAPDDKKIDFSTSTTKPGQRIVAQGYQRTSRNGGTAPANQANDLHAAIGWLLHSDLDDIPRPAIKAADEELRGALGEEDIHPYKFTRF